MWDDQWGGDHSNGAAVNALFGLAEYPPLQPIAVKNRFQILTDKSDEEDSVPSAESVMVNGLGYINETPCQKQCCGRNVAAWTSPEAMARGREQDQKGGSGEKQRSETTTPKVAGRISSWEARILECRKEEERMATRRKKKEDLRGTPAQAQKTLLGLFENPNEINHLPTEEKWVQIDIVVDSGAAESVAPESMAPWVPVVPSAGSKRGQTYMSASGDDLVNKGEQKIPVTTEEGAEMNCTFQITDVNRALCSVAKMCDKGNRVVFEAGGGYVEDIEGRKTVFRRENNVYVMSLHTLQPPSTSFQGQR